MSVEDLEYVERETGVSLDEDKPLSDIKRRSISNVNGKQPQPPSGTTGASVEPPAPKYDWFDFFLACNVNPQICERYAAAFTRDEMGEENMPDIDPTLLRTLGLKEGDILRVMKHLDAKFGRVRKGPDSSAANGETPGLFSGAGGTLRNNTRKGRPAPAVQSNDTVIAEAFAQNGVKEEPAAAPEVAPKPSSQQAPAGFDDNAWDNKPAKQAPSSTASPAPTQAAAVQPPALTGAMSELSLLSAPLQPQKTAQTSSPAPVQQVSQPTQPQATGATSDFFNQLAQPAPQAPQQISNPRTRPMAPQQTGQQSSLLPPPPSRPMSAPQNQQQSQFAPPMPLMPQNTGYQPRIAPPGQSLNEINQQRFQQQQMQPQLTAFGYGQQQQNFGQFQPLQPQQTSFQPMQPQQTGFNQYPQQPTPYQPPVHTQLMNGQMTGSPFADPPRMPYQPTGNFGQSNFPQQPLPMQGQATGLNNFLPPALQPQRTGIASQPTGINGFGTQQNGFGQYSQQNLPPVPPMPQQQTNLQPLQPQKTGPAPPIRFGVAPDAPKLTPQPTGRANLSKASKYRYTLASWLLAYLLVR